MGNTFRWYWSSHCVARQSQGGVGKGKKSHSRHLQGDVRGHITTISRKSKEE
nr:MAG TPA: hypothetical protein [Caudoviricetes sp.]DAQ59453.1 MAG TPA: hypothetical protein [Caudoviricetes sp.]